MVIGHFDRGWVAGGKDIGTTVSVDVCGGEGRYDFMTLGETSGDVVWVYCTTY